MKRPVRLPAACALALALAACASACAGEARDARDAHRYRDGLRSGDCDPIRDPLLRDDCRLATIRKRPLAEDPCGPIRDPALISECWFVLAERERDPALCARAGAFRDDCALHVLSRAFPRWIDPQTRPGDPQEQELVDRIAQIGMAPDDPRPWSAWYRWVLSQGAPLDRAACRAVPDPMRREACLQTGLALYGDRLNRARDTRDRAPLPCPLPADPALLPPDLRHTPDPELDALRASRSDLCPG